MRAASIALVVFCGGIAAGCSEPPAQERQVTRSQPPLPAPHAEPDAAPTVTAPLPDVPTPWCPPPWHGLDEDTCWLAPEGPPSSVLIYLSGIVPPGPPGPLQATMQRVVATAATRANAAVILPRGRPGLGPAATRS